jgi:hypothetical protein
LAIEFLATLRRTTAVHVHRRLKRVKRRRASINHSLSSNRVADRRRLATIHYDINSGSIRMSTGYLSAAILM